VSAGRRVRLDRQWLGLNDNIVNFRFDRAYRGAYKRASPVTPWGHRVVFLDIVDK
jgi:hypothetical protein